MEVGESKRRSNSYEVVISQMTIRVLVSMCVSDILSWFSLITDNRSIILLHLLLQCPMIRPMIEMVSISIDLWLERYLDIYRMHLYSNHQIKYTFYHSEHILLVVHLRKKNEKEKTELCRYNHRFECIESHSCLKKEKKKPTTHATEIDSTQKSCRHIICAQLICMERKQLQLSNHKSDRISHIVHYILPRWKHFNILSTGCIQNTKYHGVCIIRANI